MRSLLSLLLLALTARAELKTDIEFAKQRTRQVRAETEVGSEILIR